MIRIHFTPDDLARTRIGFCADPLVETLAAIELVRHGTGGLLFQPWRRRADSVSEATGRLLATVFPRRLPGPDLATVAGTSTTIDHAVDNLLTVPHPLLSAELKYEATFFAVQSWTWRLADRDLTARRELGAALTDFHRARVAPYWPRVQAQLDHERAVRARTILGGGVEALLSTLCPPTIRWEHPVLEIDGPGTDRHDHFLAGRGLQLVPVVFAGHQPVVLFSLADESAAPVLTYPVLRDLASASKFWQRARPRPDALAALLGRTRAAVLHQLAPSSGLTTKELARRLSLTAAAISQHTTVLRNAGLIDSHHHRGSVTHTVTRLGIHLLEGTDNSDIDR